MSQAKKIVAELVQEIIKLDDDLSQDEKLEFLGRVIGVVVCGLEAKIDQVAIAMIAGQIKVHVTSDENDCVASAKRLYERAGQ